MNMDKLEKALKNMKPTDKAKAFDLLVEAYKEESLSGENINTDALYKKVSGILQWCSSWFTN